MKAFKDLKVGTKLVAGFLSIALIACVVGVVGITKLRQIDNQDTLLYEKYTVPLADIGTMAVAFQRVRINVRDAVETKDPAQRKSYVETMNQLRELVSQRSKEFEKSLTTDEAKALFADFTQARKLYLDYADQVLQLDQQGHEAEAMALLHGDAKKAALREQELLDKLTALKETHAKNMSNENSALARSATITMLVLVVLGMAAAVGLGLLITRQITGPLAKAVEAANRLAAGDLTAKLEVTSKDESGQLLAAMDNMVTSLKDMVEQTVRISNSIASASTQLHSTSAQIATGAEEVASQSGTVATASEEMSATSSDIARNCLLAADISRKSNDTAEAGARIVQETITGMEVIADRVRQSAHTVEALGTRSEEIGNIVGTIEDIADQTNLLALNAAIEAARAGEQGRGFAVVADEVRALAERTSKATKEIGSMIKAIQGDTKEAVQAMGAGVQEAEKGAVSSRKSGDALKEIVERINEVAAQVGQIATAAEQQTATTSEVATNIQQITQVVHETASGAEQTASAAAQLSEQAVDLQRLVGRFKLA
ncbi:methyl-accepting chemotaxis protein [Geomonas sp. Red276]